MTLLDIVHPAAKTLVDISLSQDAEVGDGTTSVVLIAGELLKRAKQFIEDGVHAQTIIKAIFLFYYLEYTNMIYRVTDGHQFSLWNV